MNENTRNDHTILDDQLEMLTQNSIYFGHMSVGYNIIQGMTDILRKKEKSSRLSIQEINSKTSIDTPGFYHSKNGKNGNPKLKCDSFLEFLNFENNGNNLNIAFFKFCYVDIDKSTNTDAIFEYYKNTIDKIKNKYPELKLLHITCPLTTHTFGIKSVVRNLIIGDIGNVKRNVYNKLLKEEYEGIDPIFDLANVESTDANGQKVNFRHKGKVYNALVTDYTDDGGHLTGLGSKKAAAGLFESLIQITNE